MRDDREKLQDILEAIERIDRYAVQGRQAFEQNKHGSFKTSNHW
ncbi:hypothetical protein [Oscillatoria sp. FACHB-1407]|nr:hypothetical protein [Oscillatoria sp. FACHB-1407]